VLLRCSAGADRHPAVNAFGRSGSGPPLPLVHGGFGQIERWAPVWELLTGRWEVTAMDRRCRGTSGVADFYEIGQEYGDIAAVATWIANEAGDAIDVFHVIAA
jgi:pimeloyl-ACP methyl ester carboxylesterase